MATKGLDPITTPVEEADLSLDLKKAATKEEDYPMTDPPMRETVIPAGRFGNLCFNHVTSGIGMLLLWGLAAWCMAKPEDSLTKLLTWRAGSALKFTWFYIGTRPIFLVFVIYVGYRYGDIRLGPTNSQPEFSNLSYFTMLFAAGIAAGLFFFCVSEPLWHLDSHYHAASENETQDSDAQFAMNQTIYHWGLTAWAGYVVVALAVGLASYRFNLPMTLRSSLYPILGAYTWGWIGDVIDGFTIVVTVAGVCTSLGLGAMQIYAGLQRIGWIAADTSEGSRENMLILIIWVITVIATASVVSGLDYGIKHLSNVGFWLAQLLLFWVFALENTAYLLNVAVQSLGYYFQYSLILTSFWTDAWGQLREGEGRSIDGQSAATWWMDAWTVFYMAWWTAWSGFVGIFIARISKGRTVREVCAYGTIVPFIYISTWFFVFGGAGLRQHRQGQELEVLGGEYFNNTGFFLAEGSSFCYDVPQEDVVVDGSVIFTNYNVGITPVCKFDSNDSDNAFFNVLYSFSFPNDLKNGLGPFFSVMSILAAGLYFITSSDSGSLIVDHLSSNGREEHNPLQRIFWAFTEGAVASALLVAGGGDALNALQAASILAGLPFTVIICYQMQSIEIMCTRARKTPDSQVLDLYDGATPFLTPTYGGIFNIFEYILSFGNVHKRRIQLGLDKPSKGQAVGFLEGLLLPMLPLKRILEKEYPENTVSNLTLVGLYAVCFLAWIIFFCTSAISGSLAVFGWTAFLVNGAILMTVKNSFRTTHNIHGNFIGDLTSCIFLWPQVLVQLAEEQVRIENTADYKPWEAAKLAYDETALYDQPSAEAEVVA